MRMWSISRLRRSDLGLHPNTCPPLARGLFGLVDAAARARYAAIAASMVARFPALAPPPPVGLSFVWTTPEARGSFSVGH
jgi:hypothetical protein